MKKALALFTAALMIATMASGCSAGIKTNASPVYEAEEAGNAQLGSEPDNSKNQALPEVENVSAARTKSESDKKGSGQAVSSNDRHEQTDPTGYVATVAGQKITKDEYQYFLLAARNALEQQAGIKDEAGRKIFWKGKLGDQTAEEYTKKLALDNAKEFKILLSKANANGITLEQEELDNLNAQMNNYVETLGTGDDGTRNYEKQFGITPDKVKAINPNIRLVQKFVYDQIGKMQATEEEVKKYYEENPERYQMVTVKHILFLTRDANTSQPLSQERQDEAKKRAEEMMARVKAGEDMAALAKQYSEDPGSRNNGGEYTFTKGQMAAEFEDWSFSAKAGDIGLIKTDYGYHVMRLEKISGFDDVRAVVEYDLKTEKFRDTVKQWMKDPQYELIKNDSVYASIKILEKE